MNCLEIIWNQKLMQEDEEMDRKVASAMDLLSENLRLREALIRAKWAFKEFRLNPSLSEGVKKNIDAKISEMDVAMYGPVEDDLGPLRGEV